jgi:hypothetical protein
MKKVAAISGRKRIFRRAGFAPKRMNVNLTTFDWRKKRKMSLRADFFQGAATPLPARLAEANARLNSARKFGMERGALLR